MLGNITGGSEKKTEEKQMREDGEGLTFRGVDEEEPKENEKGQIYNGKDQKRECESIHAYHKVFSIKYMSIVRNTVVVRSFTDHFENNLLLPLPRAASN